MHELRNFLRLHRKLNGKSKPTKTSVFNNRKEMRVANSFYMLSLQEIIKQAKRIHQLKDLFNKKGVEITYGRHSNCLYNMTSPELEQVLYVCDNTEDKDNGKTLSYERTCSLHDEFAGFGIAHMMNIKFLGFRSIEWSGQEQPVFEVRFETMNPRVKYTRTCWTADVRMMIYEILEKVTTKTKATK